MVKVVGIGNPLLGDDGFGLTVLDKIEKVRLEGVVFIKLPTPSPWVLYEVFREGDYFIVVDALYDGNFGEIEVFPIYNLKSNSTKLKSLHEVSLAQVVDFLSLYDINVKGVIIGTKVKDISPKIGLSDELIKLIPNAVEKVFEVLNAVLKKNNPNL